MKKFIIFFILLLCCKSAYAVKLNVAYDVDLTSKAIAQWKMNDDAATTTLVDNIGGYNLTLTGSTSSALSVSGAAGTAIDFQNTYYATNPDIYVRFGTSGTNITKIATSFWFKVDTIASDGMVCFNQLNNLNGSFTATVSHLSKLYLGVNDAAAYVYEPFSDTTSWHHFVGIYNGKFVTTYLDGNLFGRASYTNSLNFTAGAHTLYVGVYYSTAYKFDGKIDNLILFNDDLTLPEIKFLYQQGLNGQENLTGKAYG
jgi:hypothetical protein